LYISSLFGLIQLELKEQYSNSTKTYGILFKSLHTEFLTRTSWCAHNF